MSSKTKNNSILKVVIRLTISLVIIFSILLIAIIVLNKTGLIERVNSVEKIRTVVSEGGVYSSLVFVVLQILQTTILQFPSAIVTMAGVVALGVGKAFVLSFVSIMIGSIIMFFVGRLAGKKFLNFIFGTEKTDKLVDLISNGKYAFFIMMVFPFFPDDILCAVAGVGDMSFKYFLFTNIISRLIGVAGCVFLGDSLINFNGKNLIFWLIFGVFALILIIFVIKNKNMLDKIFGRLGRKKFCQKKNKC